MTIQHSLGHQWVLEVGYVGTHGCTCAIRAMRFESLNATPTNPVVVKDVNGVSYSITANTIDNAVARTPTPGLNGYAGYQIFANDAYSHYNALQSTLSRRWSQGYFQAAYTWSKTIGCDLHGKSGVQHGVQRADDAERLARALGLRSHAPLCGELRVRFAVPAAIDGHRARGAWRLGSERDHDRAIGPAVFHLRLRGGHGVHPEWQHNHLDGQPCAGSDCGERIHLRQYHQPFERLREHQQFHPCGSALSGDPAIPQPPAASQRIPITAELVLGIWAGIFIAVRTSKIGIFR